MLHERARLPGLRCPCGLNRPHRGLRAPLGRSASVGTVNPAYPHDLVASASCPACWHRCRVAGIPVPCRRAAPPTQRVYFTLCVRCRERSFWATRARVAFCPQPAHTRARYGTEFAVSTRMVRSTVEDFSCHIHPRTLVEERCLWPRADGFARPCAHPSAVRTVYHGGPHHAQINGG